MRRVYLVLTGLLLLAISLQFYFAAVGAFDKPQDDDSFALHNLNGEAIIPALAILATIAAAIARVPGRLIGLSILPALLSQLQFVINALGGHGDDVATTGGRVILGFHAINGLIILAIAGFMFSQARALASGPKPAVNEVTARAGTADS